MTTAQHDPSPSLAGAVGGNNVAGPAPIDQALRNLEAAARVAVHAGASPTQVLARVANALTGRVNGYVERAATTAMADVFAEVAATPVATLKAREDRARARAHGRQA